MYFSEYVELELIDISNLLATSNYINIILSYVDFYTILNFYSLFQTIQNNYFIFIVGHQHGTENNYFSCSKI